MIASKRGRYIVHKGRYGAVRVIECSKMEEGCFPFFFSPYRIRSEEEI